MADFESAYNNFASRFGEGGGAARRGSFARFLDDSGGSKLAQFGGQMANTFQPPSAINAAEEEAFGAAADARNVEQWGGNLNRIGQQHSEFAALGFNAASQAQQVANAKEMAKMQAQSAQQGAMFGAIQSGIGALGGLAGAFGGGGGASSPSSFYSSSSSYGANALGSSSNAFGSGAFRYF